MTLFKQMAIGVSLLILTILAVVMVQNYQNAKQTMVEALYQITVNNISALSNKLAQNATVPAIMKSVIDSNTSAADRTPAVIKSIIDAEFDSGYYKLIELKSDTFDYKQEDNASIEGVPAWFVKFADIKIKPITTQVTSGWSVLGTLTVIPDTAIIYQALYKTFESLLYLFSIFSVISLTILSIMLHYILQPLKKMKQQAEAVQNNEFIIQKEMPYTKELQEVTLAMNSMISRVEEIYNQANAEAKRYNELLYKDAVTGLFNRKYLMAKLADLIALDGKTQGGSIILLSLSGAEKLNTLLGRTQADRFFASLAIQFKEAVKEEENLIARVNGTEFTIMLPDCDTPDALHIAQLINTAFSKLLQDYEIADTEVHIDMGLYRYPPQIQKRELLTRADTALLKAKADETRNIVLFKDENTKEAMPKTQWRTIIEQAIQQDQFNMLFYNAYDVQTKSIIHKVMTFEISTEDAKIYHYGEFIAPAINLGLTSKLYEKVLTKFFVHAKNNHSTTPYSIRLSKEFLQDKDTFEILARLFKKYAKKLHTPLYFEVSDSFAIHETATLKGFADLFKEYGFSIGINAFTGEASDYDYLKEINPLFLKSNVDFLLDQSEDSMNALHLLAHSLHIDIIASYVNTQTQLQQLQKQHITKIQGPLVDTFQ
jgi:diguanylate cyclase (GGDEF)-like protein